MDFKKFQEERFNHAADALKEPLKTLFINLSEQISREDWTVFWDEDKHEASLVSRLCGSQQAISFQESVD